MTNETDRELLELAAKAAGFNNLIFNHGQTNAYHAGSLEYMTEKHHHTPWNPLNDDGDAMRLVVKLGLFIDTYGENIIVGWVIDVNTLGCETLKEPDKCNSYAATRRAIVRAAAEIGRAMK